MFNTEQTRSSFDMQSSNVFEHFRRRIYHELIDVWVLVGSLDIIFVTIYGERGHVGDDAKDDESF